MDDITFFGETNFRGEHKRFGIKNTDRRLHALFIGRTGSGKTHLLQLWGKSDVQNDRGFCVIDPHGDYADRMLEKVKESGRPYVYLNPASHPIPYNPLEVDDPALLYATTDSIVSSVEKIWHAYAMPRAMWILRNILNSVATTNPGANLLEVRRVLGDWMAQKKYANAVKDEALQEFWDSFLQIPSRIRSEWVGPVVNKLDEFLGAPGIRKVLDIKPGKKTLNLRRLMDKGGILICNLSKGRLGEDPAVLMGSLLISGFQASALSRADIPEAERRDFCLYIDEFGSFSTLALVNIFSEARKYRLALVVAMQYLEQTDEQIRKAVLANVGTLVTFRVGAVDAEVLSQEYEGIFKPSDMMNLGVGEVYLKMPIRGVIGKPFSARTLPTWS